MEPLRAAVLGHMAGVLAASVAMVLAILAVFVYLIYIVRRQKSLDEMKTDFTNNMTHELKTPIAVAYAANDVLLNYATDDAQKRHDYLSICKTQLEKLSALVEQILSVSMEQRREISLSMEDVALAPLIEGIVALQRLKAAKTVHFDVQVAADACTVRADRSHLGNMLSNLIDNAVKYADSEVSIAISSRRTPTGVALSVADNGWGIARDRLPHIFDRFYRVQGGNRHDVKGYGLGLYYVQRMAERMGAHVEAESRLHAGTTITLCFDGQH